MLEILEMRQNEIDGLLGRVGYGHLACSAGDQPYVVPTHYFYDKPDILIYTTKGMKSEIISVNRKVCLQVEEFAEDGGWKSVVVIGEAREIVDHREREKAVDLVRSSNPTLMPALAIKWANDWIRKNVEVVYRIKIIRATGRLTSQTRVATASARPIFTHGPLDN